MTTDAVTNYGVTLEIGDGATPTEAFTSIGEIISIEAPELINEAVEATNHSSGGWKEYISGGLKEVSEFKATINYVSTDAASLIGKVEDGTKSNFKMTFPNTDVWVFSALVTTFKPLGADAQSPETLQAEVTFRPTGSSTLG